MANSKDYIIRNIERLTEEHTTSVPQVPFSLNNPPPDFLRGRDKISAPFQGKEHQRVGPVPIGFDMATVVHLTGSAITVGSTTYNKVGSSLEWISVVANNFDFTGSAAPEWIAGIGFDTPTDVISSRISVDPDNGDVYVALYANANSTGSSPITVELYDPDGVASGISAQTFNNASGMSTSYFEPFLAKFDKNGEPKNIKRLANLSTSLNIPNGIRVTHIDAQGDSDYVWMLGYTNTDFAGDATLRTFVFGPGDTNEESYQIRDDSWFGFGILLNKETFEIEALEVADPNVSTACNLQPGVTAISRTVGNGKVGNPLSLISNCATPAVVRANTGAPVSIPNPSGAGYRAAGAVYDIPDLSLDFVHAAHDNGASSAGLITTPLSDGKTFVCFTIAGGPGTGEISDAGGVSNFTSPPDDSPIIAIYDENANLSWVKRIVVNTGTSKAMLPLSIYDDPDNDRIYIYSYGYGGTWTTCTWGTGESGETTINFDVAGNHAAFHCHDRTTGELIWVHGIKQVSGTNVVFGRTPLIKVEDELRMLINISDQLEFDHDGSSEQLLDFGSDLNNVIVAVNEDGEFVSANRLWKLPDSAVAAHFSCFVLAN